MSHTPAYTVIKTPEANKLADIRDVSVNKDLPREERIAEFVRQIRDPYHFKCGGFVVRASFSLLFWGLIFPAWSVIINMEKELNTDTQTALLELRDFSVMKGVFFYAGL